MNEKKIKQAVIWKSYPDYPFIKVNQFGEVRTVDRVVVGKSGKKYHIKGCVLKQWRDKDGYMKVSFHVNGKTVHLLVHRIIATCFLPNPDNLPEVNHKDCNRTNNIVSNLEWCTSEYNIAYREKYGTALSRQIFAINLKTFKVLHFESQHEAARQLNVSVKDINNTIKGRQKTVSGYLFIENESEITKEKIQEAKNVTRIFCGVVAINLETFRVLYFKSQHETARQLGVDARRVNDVVKNKRKQTGGYWFCYADENVVEKTRKKFGDEVANEVQELMSENCD